MSWPLDATTRGDAPFEGGESSRSPSWQALATHHATIWATHLRELFASDPTRGDCLVLEAAGQYLDYSRNRRVTDETVQLLSALVGERGVRERTATSNPIPTPPAADGSKTGSKKEH